ncbi:MAG TPA: ferritin-like domain-containing protein, partial [Solirubrobacterales bacterium]|nr:ferritin-like domain-containing protein [Solirubrobacterales bacterium]
RIMRGRAARRAPFALALLAATFGIVACGGGGGETTTAVPDKEADAAILNHVLGRQLAAVDAYGAVLGRLGGLDLAAARRFRAQEQEHVDALIKALRGLGARADPEPEEIEPEELEARRDALVFLYEVESATVDSELSAISDLSSPWPPALLGSIVANQAQHLAFLRRALGAKPLDAIPSAFEDGTTAAP